MKKEIAIKLIDNIMQLSFASDFVADTIEQIDDEMEKKQFRRLFSEIMRHTNRLRMPILTEYPELDPDKKEN